MAGDWIKLRVDLHEDPAVITIASDLGISELEVVGCLYRIWAWADQQTVDGTIPGVTGAWIDRLIHRESFSKSMEKVGWLQIKKTGIALPNFDRHNGKSAKERALSADRMRKMRHADVTPPLRSERNKSVTREEKRRERKEEEKKTPPQASPPADRRSGGARLDAAPPTPTAGQTAPKKPPRPPLERPTGLASLSTLVRKVHPPDPDVEAARLELEQRKPIAIPTAEEPNVQAAQAGA